MKKILSLLLAFTIMLSLCACQGNFGGVNLNDSIAIPDDGMIEENIIKQIHPFTPSIAAPIIPASFPSCAMQILV